MESIWVKVNIEVKEKLLIGCVYRSPNNSVIKKVKLREDLGKICNNTLALHFLIRGDLTYPDISGLDMTSDCKPTTESTFFLKQEKTVS